MHTYECALGVLRGCVHTYGCALGVLRGLCALIRIDNFLTITANMN